MSHLWGLLQLILQGLFAVLYVLQHHLQHRQHMTQMESLFRLPFHVGLIFSIWAWPLCHFAKPQHEGKLGENRTAEQIKKCLRYSPCPVQCNGLQHLCIFITTNNKLKTHLLNWRDKFVVVVKDQGTEYISKCTFRCTSYISDSWLMILWLLGNQMRECSP